MRSDETWRPRPTESSDAAEFRAEAEMAAAWIAEKAGEGGIGFLCVDVDGSNCSWLTLPNLDPMLVAAALDRAEEASPDWRPPDTAAASIQALATPTLAPPRRLPGRKPSPNGEIAGERLAVIAVPDALARIVIDELDDRNVPVDSAASLWHAMALAWDPASPLLSGSAATSDNLVRGESPVTAVFLVDPEGRVVWAWSRAGELLTGGVVLTPGGSGGEPVARVSKAALGRIVTDWLGWSVQLGVTPARVVCVATSGAEGTDDDLSPAQIGATLGRGWAGATVDMAVVDDPIGATLQRLAGMESTPPETPRTALTSLTRRPRRTHRAMYLWGALAMALLGAGLAAVGWKAWSNASAARQRIATVREETRKAVLEAAPVPNNDAIAIAIAESNPRGYIEDRIAQSTARQNVNTGLPPVRPILSELESLSFVLANDDIELEEIQLSDSIIHVYVYVPSTKAAEELLESLQNIGNDHCTWTMSYQNSTKDKLQRILLDGTWKPAGGKS